LIDCKSYKSRDHCSSGQPSNQLSSESRYDSILMKHDILYMSICLCPSLATAAGSVPENSYLSVTVPITISLPLPPHLSLYTNGLSRAKLISFYSCRSHFTQRSFSRASARLFTRLLCRFCWVIHRGVTHYSTPCTSFPDLPPPTLLHGRPGKRQVRFQPALWCLQLFQPYLCIKQESSNRRSSLHYAYLYGCIIP
jgi:hypothetical protein